MMTRGQIEAALQVVVAELHLSQARTHVEMNRRWIHVLVTTPSFAGKTSSERDNLIWREFEKRLDDETILAITQCYLLTPEEEAEAHLDFAARGAADGAAAVAETPTPYTAKRSQPKAGKAAG